MNAANVDVDEVVRRVLDRLRAGTAPVGTGGPNASPTHAATSDCGCGGGHAAVPCNCQHESPTVGPDVEAVDGELRLVEPVVSLGQLAGRLQGIRIVTVSSSAVVTPSARDLLRQKNIAIARTDGATPHPGGGGIVLGLAETPFDPAALVRTLVQQGTQVQRLAQCGLVTAVDEIVDAVVHGGQIGVLLTRQSAAALCLANRTRGVRAALGSDLEAVRAARSQIAANLLIIDPSGRGLFDLSAMVRACVAGPAGCPEPLQQRLG